MHFNSHEVSMMAQNAMKIDKQGILYVKEKQDNIFRTVEGQIKIYSYLYFTILMIFFCGNTHECFQDCVCIICIYIYNVLP